MGKKKIIAQSEQDVLKEEEALTAAQKKAAAESSKAKSKRIEKGRAYIQSSYNNTLLTITDNNGDVLGWASSGALGFRGPKKATPFAASKVVEAVLEKIQKTGIKELAVYVRGIGSGREAAIRALASRGMEITTIVDTTPIPHNGCRPRKARRV
ncbi:MAG: 30S ribosomal protein S11 [Candidatus Portnoybacteria bacterium]|nr:30S ribosomal protein S11 [Candidatus Portnoybacteria bacterium]